ncbi:MAG TPA: hypothetical protein DEP72_00930 [Clostridiales bacterium]|nr:MAG: hypothetical protein A2Y18_05025 [Clostridiales bacterium GWD2_32_19]HCC06717.1 hypothetical protein [Clostridiales bacterium]
MKYRAKYTKGDNVKFVGHLDLLRSIQRAIKRAELVVKYSQGFNPHQVFSIAQPLAVGHTSVGEYMDFELVNDMSEDEVKQRFNDVSPEGIKIIEVRKLNDGENKAAALVEYGSYKVVLDKNISDDTIKNFISQDTIEVEKETKSGTKIADIKNDIIDAKIEGTVLHATISTGSNQNLKIELLAKALYTYAGEEFDENKIDVERQDLYYMYKDELKGLME